MNTLTLSIILVVAAVVIGAVIVVLISGRRRSSKKLHEKYGSEYDLTMEKSGNRKAGEKALQGREDRVSKLDIHDLDAKERNRYQAEWIEIQANFVNDPPKAVEDGDKLISKVMMARGFPVNNFEQRAADVSVLYPDFVTNYRSAEAIALKNRSNGASTEELRQAMVYYRNLFNELLGTIEGTEAVTKDTEPAEEKVVTS
jgi:hypothetical protein